MSGSPNPYESPRGIEATAELAADRVLTATFVVDEAWIAETTRMLTRRQDLAAGLAFGGIWLSCVAFGLFASANPSQPAAGLLVGMALGSVGGLFVGLPLFTAFRWYNQFHMRPKYPVGLCQVRIDLQELTITCADKCWTYPLKRVRQGVAGDAVNFRIVKSDNRFLVWETADFGDDDFTSWRSAVSERIKLW
jgi:hypothetical protein